MEPLPVEIRMDGEDWVRFRAYGNPSIWYLPVDQWREFRDAVKEGKYDDM